MGDLVGPIGAELPSPCTAFGDRPPANAGPAHTAFRGPFLSQRRGLIKGSRPSAGYILDERLYEPKVIDLPLNWGERREEEATPSLPNKMLELIQFGLQTALMHSEPETKSTLLDHGI